MIEILTEPWPWFISGPLIALVMLLLLLAGGEFGVSSTLRSFCSIGGAGKHCDFFDFNWRSQIWNIVFVFGAVIGGFIANQFLMGSEGVSISQATLDDLKALGIEYSGGGYVPESLFNWQNLFSFKGIFLMIIGGFFVGFGTRWAGGCTSGHAISGLSNLQLPSLIAVIGFFIGGLIMTHFLFPIIF